MKVRNTLLSSALFSLMLIRGIGHSGCANSVPPTGGPRDTIPPRLIYVTPGDTTKHFNTNKIVFNFDEYIDPKDIRTELIVSPVPKVEPIVDSKLKTLTVKIKDTLQPNTTYTLDFGKSIRDYNEGNILKNFRYVFTTGDHIDQGSFGGTVVIAVNGKVDSSMIVILHRKFADSAGLKGNDSAVAKDGDSAVAKDRPRYITRIDTTGRLRFRNIHPGTYAVYALKDESGSHKYLSKSQLFAFADSPVVITRNTPPLDLYAYAEAPLTKLVAKSTGTTAPAPAGKTAKARDSTRELHLLNNVIVGEFKCMVAFRV